MKADNPLDRHLDAVGSRMPEYLRAAATELADHLDLAWMIARTVFEDRATPEHAPAICDRLRSGLPAALPGQHTSKR